MYDVAMSVQNRLFFIPILYGRYREPERDLAGAVEKLKNVVADETAKLALLTRPRR
jgi:hypothetical protein